jgi:acyl-CoA thioester hydrolase
MKPSYNTDNFPFWTEIQVRFRDLDALNHVNNAVFNSYFEEARIRFTQTIPSFIESMKKGKSFVLVRADIQYIKPILYPSSILIGSAISEYGNSSLSGIQAIYDSKSRELHAVAQTTGVWFDLKTHRPIRLPDIPDRNSYLFKG